MLAIDRLSGVLEQPRVSFACHPDHTFGWWLVILVRIASGGSQVAASGTRVALGSPAGQMESEYAIMYQIEVFSRKQRED